MTTHHQKSTFNKQTFIELLRKLTTLSDDLLDRSLQPKIKSFLDTQELHTDVGVWNFFKELLDLSVYGGLASGGIMTLIDLEPFYVCPTGAYSREAGNMNQAPWRTIRQA